MSSVLRGCCRVLLAPTKTGSFAAASVSAVEKPKPKPTKSKGEAKPSSGRSSGLNKPVQVSKQLASFLGASQSSRSQVVKVIWAHIKLHNLQNPADKREINCDTKLKLLFDGREKVNFLEIAKFLSPHFVKNA